MQLQIPPNYRPSLDVMDTQRAIRFIRSWFHKALEKDFGLTRVSAPLFVLPASGENDNLSGKERPVAFEVPDMGCEIEIVHSLAKWKRVALQRYGFGVGQGIFTEMNAIRRDEVLDNTHSIYVDQWDWERVITPNERNLDTCIHYANELYTLIRKLAEEVRTRFNIEVPALPEKLFVISYDQLVATCDQLDDKGRENEITRKHGAVFLSKIGNNGDRAPDYDDWTMNGDILLHFPTLDAVLEISSMGVRVDAATLQRQCEKRDATDRLTLPYHQAVLQNKLPQTVGGGLGQSRICQWLLSKAHVGEVQASVWPEQMRKACAAAGIKLL
ncbi:MAG: aspartate--ammonia ligase [Defluviitaleaceae bacterium]|nr:aspartate--ammonia ligase [Defluviitaleaceae bacterium]